MRRKHDPTADEPWNCGDFISKEIDVNHWPMEKQEMKEAMRISNLLPGCQHGEGIRCWPGARGDLERGCRTRRVEKLKPRMKQRPCDHADGEHEDRAPHP
jgi:hypothetical protein